MDALRDLVGRGLERGALGAAVERAPAGLGERAARAVAEAAERAWAGVAGASLARPLSLPRGVRVIGVGSAVLGGAGKTPIAVALARALAARGEAVALVSHAYRASPGRARVVLPGDDPRVVGDDALASARMLADDRVAVVVAPRRQGAVDAAAATGARTVVVDGLLQSAPERLAEGVLVLDAEAPWGAGACPPLGDLRAAPPALLAAADRVAVVIDRLAPGLEAGDGRIPAGATLVPSDVAGAFDAHGRRHVLGALRSLRVGLILAIARPERVLFALARRGVEPAVVVELADHARLDALALARRARAAAPPGGLEPDVWLTTVRCAAKLPATLAGAEVLALDHRVDVTGLLPLRL
jgi:tetraacyldisaccharide 4'-kinase